MELLNWPGKVSLNSDWEMEEQQSEKKELHKQRGQCLWTAGEAGTCPGMLGTSRKSLAEPVQAAMKCQSEDGEWESTSSGPNHALENCQEFSAPTPVPSL